LVLPLTRLCLKGAAEPVPAAVMARASVISQAAGNGEIDVLAAKPPG